jgi:hypothetical protein
MVLPTASRLNAICPYFTMFPLEFPLGILSRRAASGDRVLDPFCGRGTTNFAARLAGLRSVGVDTSPVAAAITASKLVNTTAEQVLAEASNIIQSATPQIVPDGDFWEWAFHPSVLATICTFRQAFLEDCSTPTRVALRGLVLGALHGPTQITFPSYFSNQCPRTYAPKPGYAVRYWKSRDIRPQLVNVLDIIKRRATRYFSSSFSEGGIVRLADSRFPEALLPESLDDRFAWVITSPPYYGMKTYIPDQWLRNWFVGGISTVDYSIGSQLQHSSPEQFATDLKQVWKNAENCANPKANLVIRFGGITDRNVNPLDLLKHSLADSGWRITTALSAGSANEGKRQANAFLRARTKPVAEYDIWAKKA